MLKHLREVQGSTAAPLDDMFSACDDIDVAVDSLVDHLQDTAHLTLHQLSLFRHHLIGCVERCVLK